MKSPEKDPNFGWWELTTTITPSTEDLEHIAGLIINGFTAGEMFGEKEEGINKVVGKKQKI